MVGSSSAPRSRPNWSCRLSGTAEIRGAARARRAVVGRAVLGEDRALAGRRPERGLTLKVIRLAEGHGTAARRRAPACPRARDCQGRPGEAAAAGPPAILTPSTTSGAASRRGRSEATIRFHLRRRRQARPGASRHLREGISAALLMASLRAGLRAVRSRPPTWRRTLHREPCVLRVHGHNHYATLFFGVYRRGHACCSTELRSPAADPRRRCATSSARPTGS